MSLNHELCAVCFVHILVYLQPVVWPVLTLALARLHAYCVKSVRTKRQLDLRPVLLVTRVHRQQPQEVHRTRIVQVCLVYLYCGNFFTAARIQTSTSNQ